MSTLHDVLARLVDGLPLKGDGHEEGQGMAEYALIITFVALVVVGSLTVLGTSISGPINTVSGKF